MKMKIHLLGVVGVAFWISAAHGDVWDSFTNRYDYAFNSSVVGASSNEADAQTSYKNLQWSAKQVQEKLDAQKKKLNEETRSVKSLTTTQDAIEAEIKSFRESSPPPPPSHFLFFSVSSDQQKESDAAKRRASEISAKLAAEDAQHQKTEKDLEQSINELEQQKKSIENAQKAVQEKAAALAQVKSPSGQALLAQQTAERLLSEQRDNGFDAKLLFSDLEVLKARRSLSQEQVQGIKQAWDNQLNGTLIGRYVNQQIQKAMASVCDPEFQNACTAKKIDSLNRIIQQKLSAPRGVVSEASTTDQAKPAASDSNSAPANGTNPKKAGSAN